MKVKSYVVLLGTTILLAGCASQMGRKEVSHLHLRPGETIAVASFLSVKPNFYGIATVFNSVKGKLQDTSWNFNPYIENMVARDLSDAGYEPVKLDSARLMAVTGPAVPKNKFWAQTFKGNGVNSALVQAAAEKGASELLVIGTGEFEDPWFMSNTYLSGYGVMQRDFMGIRSQHTTRTYVSLEMWLINVKTGHQSGAASCIKAHSRWMKYWINKPSDFTKDNADYTRAKLHELIGKAEAECMNELGFFNNRKVK